MQKSADSSLFFLPFRSAAVPLAAAPFRGAGDGLAAAPLESQDVRNLACEYFIGDTANWVLRILRRPSDLEKPFWPLILYGPPLTGKTCLAVSIAHRICADQSTPMVLPPKPIVMVAADLSRQLADALETNSLSEYRARLLKADVLVLDDLHNLEGQVFSQSQLVGLLDELLLSGVPVIVTMNQSPAACPGLSEQLVSRLTNGLVLGVSLPGPGARRMVVESMAEQLGLGLTSEAVDWAVACGPSTVPSIRSFFSRLRTVVGERHLPALGEVDVAVMVKATELMADRASHEQILQRIVKTVATEFQVPARRLNSDCRRKTTVLARGVATYLIRTVLKMSFVRIGLFFRGRDHSTALHAYRSITTRLERDPVLSDRIRLLRLTLYQQLALPLGDEILPGKSCSSTVVERVSRAGV